jgi:hypothetical protein
VRILDVRGTVNVIIGLEKMFFNNAKKSPAIACGRFFVVFMRLF